MRIKFLSIAILPVVSILFFFGSAECILKIIGFKPTLTIDGGNIPFWARNSQSVINGIQTLSTSQSPLSDDVNAYEDDLLLCYRLIPQLNISVKFYDLSGRKLKGNFPNWTIITDSTGHRVSGNQLLKNNEKSSLFKYQTKIAVMGGSSFFGWGLNYDDVFISQLEVSLNKKFPDILFNCINYSAPGYAMSQHLLILKQLINGGIIPDIIILDATSNCDVPVFLTDKDAELKRLSIPGKLKFNLERFRFFQALEMLVTKVLNTKKIPPPSLTPRIPLNEYTDYLTYFQKLTREYHIKFIMIGLCVSKE